MRWNCCGWIDYPVLVLVRYGIWDFYAWYDLDVWFFDAMSYDSSIFIITASIFSILVFWYLDGNDDVKLRKLVEIFLIQGIQLSYSLMDMVLTFEFGHGIMILKMVISDKVDYIENGCLLSIGIEVTSMSMLLSVLESGFYYTNPRNTLDSGHPTKNFFSIRWMWLMDTEKQRYWLTSLWDCM